MFERFDTPEEIFSYKLGSALSMERQLVAFSASSSSARYARRSGTRWPYTARRRSSTSRTSSTASSSCTKPSMTRLRRHRSVGQRKQDDDQEERRLAPDVLILAVATEAEHYEIAVYETLIANAEARKATAVAKLLSETSRRTSTRSPWHAR